MYKRILSCGLCVAFFSLYSIYKIGPALNSSEITLAVPFGDGLGTFANQMTLLNEIRLQGLSVLQGPYLDTQTLAGGLNYPLIYSPLNKVIGWALSFVSSPLMSYEAHAFFYILLTALSGTALLRYLGSNWLISICAGVLFSSMANTDTRIGHHLSLAFAPGFLLQLLCVFYATNRPNVGRMTLLGVVSLFSLMLNEYYGYFGTLFCVPLFILLLCKNGFRELRYGEVLKNVSIAVALSSGLAALCYQEVIVDVLTHSNDSTIQRHIHSDEEFSYYGMDRNRLEWAHLMQTSIESLADWQPKWLAISSPRQGEFTYRFGFVTPLILVFGVLFYILSFVVSIRNGFNGRRLISDVFSVSIWVVSILFVALFALKPEETLSLANFTKEYFSTFRVGVRALMPITIGVSVLAFIAIRYVTSYLPKYFSIGAQCLLLFCLLSEHPIRKQWNHHKVVIPPAYSYLMDKEPGVVLSLPFSSNYTSPPEAAYQDTFNHSFLFTHTTLNGLRKSPYFEEHWAPMVLASASISNPSVEMLDNLLESGVRYIITTNDAFHNYSCLDDYDKLKKLKSFDSSTVYESKIVKDWNAEHFLSSRQNFLGLSSKPPHVFDTAELGGMFAGKGKNEYSNFRTRRLIGHRLGHGGTPLYGPYHKIDHGTYKAMLEVKILEAPAGSQLRGDVTLNMARSFAREFSFLAKDYSINKWFEVPIDFVVGGTGFVEFRVQPHASGLYELGKVRVEKVANNAALDMDYQKVTSSDGNAVEKSPESHVRTITNKDNSTLKISYQDFYLTQGSYVLMADLQSLSENFDLEEPLMNVKACGDQLCQSVDLLNQKTFFGRDLQNKEEIYIQLPINLPENRDHFSFQVEIFKKGTFVFRNVQLQSVRSNKITSYL